MGIPSNTIVIEVIDTYDSEPMIHLREDGDGQKYYCHMLNYAVGYSRYLMVPVTNADVAGIKDNTVPIRSILDRRPAFLLRWGDEEIIDECTGAIDSGLLPAPLVTLNRKV